jgi:IS5 family transposase
MVSQARKRFPPPLNAYSFDKGFHCSANQIALKAQLDLVVLPRKGKLSQQAREEEQAAPFVKARRAHSGVESAINGLEAWTGRLSGPWH